jgi:hypothetical protein
VIGAGADGLQDRAVAAARPCRGGARHAAQVRTLDRLLLSTAKDAASRRHRDLVVGLIVDRLVSPRSKLGFVRAVNGETPIVAWARCWLGPGGEREVYAALDWLLEQQSRIETGWRGGI